MTGVLYGEKWGQSFYNIINSMQNIHVYSIFYILIFSHHLTANLHPLHSHKMSLLLRRISHKSYFYYVLP